MGTLRTPPPGYRWICRPFIRLRDGRVLWAKDYGHKAWCFLVPDK